MILSLFLSALEHTVNLVLSCDPDALKKLSALEKKSIKVDCTDWQFEFFIEIENHELHFYKRYFETPNTIISGTLNNFLHIFMKGAETQTLFQYPIDIEGDTCTVEILRDIFKNLDYDLEEKLSRILGDVLAHKIFTKARSTKNIAKTSANKLTEQVQEYIHIEAKQCPTTAQVEAFYADIAKLRDDVDRFETKVNLTTYS